MTRYLRFAAAGLFALLTVALIGLWVRSQFRKDSIMRFSNPRYVVVTSRSGVLGWESVKLPRKLPPAPRWTVQSTPVQRRAFASGVERSLLSRLGFNYQRVAVASATGLVITIPTWSLIAVSAALAALFAFKGTWRFTIRTLLIATTLIAAALGIGVCLL
jgi:hypothetical protein